MKHRSRSDWDALTLRALTTVVGLLALSAFTLSFDALRELAIMAGLRPRLAFLWPLIVDGFIVVATAAAVVMRGRSRKQTWYPWATLVLFASISVIGNALHARSTADTAQVAVTVAAIVSAVPAIALLLASHLFVLVLDTPRPAPAANEPASNRTPPRKPTHDPEPTRAPAAHPTNRAATARPATTTARPGTGTGSDWEAWIGEELAAGRDLTGTDVSEKFGVSPATGRRRLAAVKATGGSREPVALGSSNRLRAT